jgi:hypothetical protein
MLPGIELFATGTWRGSKTIDVNAEDLDKMVNSFNNLNMAVSGFGVPLKIGHLTTSGQEALGWVKRIWRNGDKIVGDVEDVPEWIVDMVKLRRYTSVSIEMFSKLEHEGKTFENVLAGVALLGAEWPAVKGLKPLPEALGFAHSIGEKLEIRQDMTQFSQEQVDALVEAAVLVATQASDKAHGDAGTVLQATIKAASERADRAEAALQTFQMQQSEKEIDEVIDASLKAGVLLPKSKDAVKAFANALPAKIVVGDKTYSRADAVRAFAGGLSSKIDFNEKGLSKQADSRDSGVRAHTALHEKAKSVVESTRMTYKDAVERVLKEDPELARQYAAGE